MLDISVLKGVKNMAAHNFEGLAAICEKGFDQRRWVKPAEKPEKFTGVNFNR